MTCSADVNPIRELIVTASSGVTAPNGSLDSEVPAALGAVIVKRQVTPLVSFFNVHLVTTQGDDAGRPNPGLRADPEQTQEWR